MYVREVMLNPYRTTSKKVTPMALPDYDKTQRMDHVNQIVGKKSEGGHMMKYPPIKSCKLKMASMIKHNKPGIKKFIVSHAKLEVQ